MTAFWTDGQARAGAGRLALRRAVRAAVVVLAAACAVPGHGESTSGKWGLRAGNPAGETPQAQAAAPASVSAITIVRAGARTRVSFKLSAPIDPVPFLLANPDRAVIDLPDVVFSLPAVSGDAAQLAKKGASSIKSYRFGQIEAGKSRVVMDLSAPVVIASSRLETANGEHIYSIEFEPAPRAAFLAAVQTGSGRASPAPANSTPSGVVSADGLPVIVLDPGHGGIDAGARGAGQAFEKEVVLAFARSLGEQLEASGRYRVVFTRTEDVFISLPDRVKVARAAGAKLFISIHADTLNQGWVEGATIYTVSDKASDTHAARLAEKENAADKLAGVEAGEETSDVSDILFDLTRRETRTFSHFFARSLVAYWKDAGKLNKNPIRSAGFRVLMAPDVPSVLLELGYLSSKAEAAKLAQPEWRARAAASVARSVDAFFAPRLGQAGAASVEPGGNPGPAGAAPEAGVAPALR